MSTIPMVFMLSRLLVYGIFWTLNAIAERLAASSTTASLSFAWFAWTTLLPAVCEAVGTAHSFVIYKLALENE